MSRLETEFLVELHGAARDYVACGSGIADYLGIAVELHLGLLVVAVEDGEHCLAVILACDDIDALVWDELCLLALDDDIVALAPSVMLIIRK